ncbi:MAG: MFS transporter [Geminicoccaceae bacterium]|nr:MFS transporter [Geminicoccaceae bacterium]
MSPTPLGPEALRLRRAHGATRLAFLLVGTVWGSWAPHIALVQARLGLSPGVLGLVLLTVALGTLSTMPVIGGLITRSGSGPVVRAAAPFVALALVLPALAPSLPLLVLGGVLLGGFSGAFDVAMNAQGIAIEARLKRPIVSALHAYYSLGGLLGAGAAALLLPLIPPYAHVLLVTLVALGIALTAMRGLMPGGFDQGGGAKAFTLPPRAVLGIGALTLVAMMSEGAIQDWSAVYLYRDLATGPGVAALGFAAFAATMTIGRFTGDRLRARIDDGRLLVLSALVAAAGLGGGLLIPYPAALVLGLGLMGFGMANMVPLLFVAGARVPGIGPSVGLAAVATVGYMGFMAGPVVIGGIAQGLGLKVALLLVALGVLCIALAAPRVLPKG